MELHSMKTQLAETIRHYNDKGWSPATSTNYSFKDENGQIWVSRSGIDKSKFHADDFITVDNEGKASGDFITVKPSAETLIHCVIYELFPETKVILHSHSVFPVVLSTKVKDAINFEGYEVQKGLDGQTSHENIISIPVFDNTQNMEVFAITLKENRTSIQQHSFIIRKHGTYAWGKSLFEAKRHLESLEYLCQCEWMLKN